LPYVVTASITPHHPRYEEEDEALLQQADADVVAERQRATDGWAAFVSGASEYTALLDGFRRRLLGTRYDEKPFKLQNVTVEQVIESKEEPYKP
jgi:hypothetical protein